MATLIANLSTGKGTWGHVNRLLGSGKFEKIILVTNQWTKENFQNEKEATLVVIDTAKPAQELSAALQEELRPLITDTEVALCMISGSGAEHMATLAALLKLGIGIRLVVMGEEGIAEL